MAIMDSRPPLNEKLLNCVLEHIEREVERGSNKYDQNNWANIDWDLVHRAMDEGEDTEIDQTMCGSAGCVAGWACMLSTPLENWRTSLPTGSSNNYLFLGQQKLGLTRGEAGYLFRGTIQRSQRAQLEQIKGRVRVIREARAKGESFAYHRDYMLYRG